MKFSSRLRGCVIVLCVLAMLVGCASHLVPRVGIATKKEAIFPFTDDGADADGLVQTGDAELRYVLRKDGDRYALDGEMRIDNSITRSFDIIQRLKVKMSFVDERGDVLQTVDISPLIRVNEVVARSYPVRSSGGLPSGAAALAFNWDGVFCSNADETRDCWNFNYFPYR